MPAARAGEPFAAEGVKMEVKTLGASLLLLASVRAEALPATPQPGPPIRLHRASSPIVIDGDLSDPAWTDAAVVDTFYETNPGDNTPPKVRTVAYLTYDDRFFYIGLRCDDPEINPHAVRYEKLSHDKVLRDTLKVMDAAAIDLCRSGKLPILVFNMTKPGNIRRVVLGEPLGTLVLDERGEVRPTTSGG